MNSNVLRYLIMPSFIIFLVTCSGDSDLSVREDIEKYPNGTTKIHVRFHPENNVLERHIPPKQTANGCHFGWNEKLYKFITELGK